jgi:hypothetical protein
MVRSLHRVSEGEVRSDKGSSVNLAHRDPFNADYPLKPKALGIKDRDRVRTVALYTQDSCNEAIVAGVKMSEGRDAVIHPVQRRRLELKGKIHEISNSQRGVVFPSLICHDSKTPRQQSRPLREVPFELRLRSPQQPVLAMLVIAEGAPEANDASTAPFRWHNDGERVELAIASKHAK